jgi:uncharacterized protein YggL (DUF469 family)
MKKRIRKKIRTKEFREMGFEISFTFNNAKDNASLETFWDAFIENAIEANGLAFGGSCNEKWDGFIVKAYRGSVSVAEREQVEAWLKAQPDVTEIKAGAFTLVNDRA